MAACLFYSQILNTVTGLLRYAPQDDDYRRALWTLRDRYDPFKQGSVEGVHQAASVVGFMTAIAEANPQPAYHLALRHVAMGLGLHERE